MPENDEKIKAVSKYGANEMAKKGSDYTKILAKYYKGTVIE